MYAAPNDFNEEHKQAHRDELADVAKIIDGLYTTLVKAHADHPEYKFDDLLQMVKDGVHDTVDPAMSIKEDELEGT